MKKIKTYYTFLYYTLYKSIDTVKPAFLTDFKAGVVLMALEVWFIATILVYVIVITRKKILPINFLSSPLIYVFVGAIVFFKIAVFIYKDRWKGYISEFDSWPKEKVHKWKIIAWIFMAAIVANLVLSIYLLYQIDWSQYR